MSTFKCEVVPVVLEPHPNADTLSVVKVWGYTVVVKTEDWVGRDRGVYIPPDSMVPLNHLFEFLFSAEEHAKWLRDFYDDEPRPTKRVTVRRFRGVYSQGLLMPVEGFVEFGTDTAESWGITHYEPPIKYQTHGVKAAPEVPGPPGLVIPKYDVENFNRYHDLIPEGTPVYITEKIHGCNARYVWHSYTAVTNPEGAELPTFTVYGNQYCGSRSTWKAWASTDPWNMALQQNPWIEEWCEAHPNMVLYGEVFGQVQDLKYGAKEGQLFFRAFDVLHHGEWADYGELEGLVRAEHRAPVLYVGPFQEALARELAERDSVLCPGQLSEGVVICPLVEMTHHAIGRVQLKIVSNRYLEKSK